MCVWHAICSIYLSSRMVRRLGKLGKLGRIRTMVNLDKLARFGRNRGFTDSEEIAQLTAIKLWKRYGEGWQTDENAVRWQFRVYLQVACSLLRKERVRRTTLLNHANNCNYTIREGSNANNPLSQAIATELSASVHWSKINSECRVTRQRERERIFETMLR